MKKIKYMALALLMAATSIIPVFAESVEIKFTPGSLFYQVGEESKNISQEIYNKNGRMMVPVEYLGEALNLKTEDVNWDKYSDTLTIYSGNKIIQMTMGNTTMSTNEGKIIMDVAPEYKDLIPMFPIKYIADQVGAEYEYKDGSLVFQAEKEEVVITYDYDYNMLLEKAYDNSKTLDKADLSIEKAEELVDDARDDVKSVPKNPADDALQEGGGTNTAKNQAYTNFRSQEFAKAKAERDLDTTKEKIQYQLKGLYYDLLKTMEDKELSKVSLDVSKDTMDQTIIKFENGMASEYEKNKAERNYKEAQKTYEMAKKNEQTAYEALNYLVGLNPEERYELDKNVVMKELDTYEMNVETHIIKAIESSPDIWALEQQIELGELGVKLFVFNVGKNYEATKIDVQTSKIDLRDTKEKYEESLRKLNTSIKTLEDKYESDTIAYEKAKDDYDLAQLNEALGLAIPLDVKKAEFQLENTKNALNETVRTYNKTVDVYLKPWIQ
ncbi:stalk domain-containing protein [Anaeromicrobium sediminis]|uniref:Copper amine oxidase-like N-terminal domain-containing protein n=1 Tax=Anaeromicrobium sediminis TaxID=1478221 RepID=A0A267MFG5_9FIRM|nr:stalk domain-containing protein [Anaeromicrobium sediminis]PAB58324.1 hypothetical protein CCE28_16145 [Anaeromicrobium sediminis]